MKALTKNQIETINDALSSLAVAEVMLERAKEKDDLEMELRWLEHKHAALLEIQALGLRVGGIYDGWEDSSNRIKDIIKTRIMVAAQLQQLNEETNHETDRTRNA